MMDISYSNMITDTIGVLRKNIYNLSQFQSDFRSGLEDILSIQDIKISPDYYGGLNIDLKTDGYTSNDMNKIASVLIRAISNSYNDINKFDFMTTVNNIGTNLINIISTGVDSLVIKI